MEYLTGSVIRIRNTPAQGGIMSHDDAVENDMFVPRSASDGASEEKTDLSQDDEFLQGKGNLLYLEEVCHDPVTRLVSMLDQHSSSEEMKCLLLNILSSGKIDALKASLMGSDTSGQTDPTTDSSEKTLPIKKERKLHGPPSGPGNLARQRSAPNRCQSERRLSTYSGAALRSVNGSTRRKVAPSRSSSFSTKDGSAMPEDMGERQRRRSSSRIRRAGSADALRSNSFCVPSHRRVRSTDREQISRSLNDAIEKDREQTPQSLSRPSRRTPDVLSMSMHNNRCTGSGSNSNQQLGGSLHQRTSNTYGNRNGSTNENTLYGTSTRPSARRSSLNPRSKKLDFCAEEDAVVSHNGIIKATLAENDHQEDAKSEVTKTTLETLATNSDTASSDACAQFHPNGVQHVPIVQKSGVMLLKNASDLATSNHSKKERSDKKGIYQFLTRQLSKEKLLGKKKSHIPMDNDDNESDIESLFSGDSVSSFASSHGSL